MPKSNFRAPKIQHWLMVFKSRMTQIERKLKAEGEKRDRTLAQAMAEQFCRLTDEMSYRPRRQSLLYFSWRVYEGVSNHFWPASALPEDRPSVIREGTKPFLCVGRFEALDTNAMSFERMVDFIQCNGDKYFRWPKKPKRQRKSERDAKKGQYLKTKLNQPGDHISNPTVIISPLRSAQPRAPVPLGIPEKIDLSNSLCPPLFAFSTPDKTHSFSPIPPIWNIPESSPRRTRLTLTKIDSCTHNLWDEDIETTEASRLENPCLKFTPRSPTPRLSVICQPGWDLNNKAKWIPASGVEYENDIVPYRSDNAQPLGPVEPSIGTVSFNKVPEKDVEAFLSSFLGSGGV
ncbi:hypothetical protein FHL15_008418 [Xylaria flabelliformis]|uniref:Uncharacterized protein n=1 Tax=Xylaria flabelliformis TaxID=2512241 RepID=A0A553HRR9_9PEZI|nr:hypothetical protein FHL15_008418 [Xylaria flabelliformis]